MSAHAPVYNCATCRDRGIVLLCADRFHSSGKCCPEEDIDWCAAERLPCPDCTWDAEEKLPKRSLAVIAIAVLMIAMAGWSVAKAGWAVVERFCLL